MVSGSPDSGSALVPGAHSARIVTIADSRASRRSRAGGKASPWARCSRSHQPAPMPTNARPPVSADRVAAALAVMPAERNVTGVHSVPSRSPVPTPARAPSVTHGSGIGSQARPTWGIWIRWSISGEAGEPGLVGRPRDADQPVARVLAPGEAGHLEHDLDARRGAAVDRALPVR